MRDYTVSGRDPGTGDAIRVTVESGRIAAITPAAGAESAWIAPALVDLQVNGYAGHDLNGGDLTVETVAALADAMEAVGVGRFAPTLITAPEATIARALRVIADARADDPRLRAMIPFVHVEGPHISPNDGPRGAHPASAVRACDLDEFARWQAASDGAVGLVTLSPHDPRALPYIKVLRGIGVHVSIGHSDATATQIHDAAAAGAVLSTHLGNGVAATLPRHNNLLWAQLADDRLDAMFIADGHHLPADTLKAMIRAKGVARSILVSDCVALGGMVPGIYHTPVGGRVELDAAGRLSLAGTPYLAGAALSLKDGIARAVRDAGVTLAEALTMATANPARFTGKDAALRVGERGDLIRFHWQPGDDTLHLDSCRLATSSR